MLFWITVGTRVPQYKGEVISIAPEPYQYRLPQVQEAVDRVWGGPGAAFAVVHTGIRAGTKDMTLWRPSPDTQRWGGHVIVCPD